MTTEGQLKDSDIEGSETAITISLLTVNNIIGSKSDNWNMIVKSEFGDRILGESPKIEVHKSEPCHINFNSYLHFQPTSKEIDEICNFPIILNFIEILPKEKKQKDEKTVLMYQCVVDLINLINSCETEHFMTLQVHRVDNVTNDITKIVDIVSTAKVKISVRESIFSEKLLESKVCIASLTLESLFSPPDAWVNSTGNFYYVGAFPFIFNDKENLLIFNEGHLEPPLTSRNKSLQLKRWNCRNGKIMGNAVYMNNSFLSFEDEKSQVGQNDKSFIKFREEVEVEKSHVTWNNEQRKYMDEECTKTLSDNIAKYRLFPLEIFRVSAAAPGKSKKDDEINVSYHGVAYIDMTPLLYPGVTYLRGYFRVCGFNEQEYTKTTQQKTILENATKIVSSLSHKNGNSPFPKSKKDKDKQSVKDVKSTNKADITDDGSGYNTEGQIFNENKTYVSIDITLSRPLVKKRTIEAINKTISEIIPDRPAYPFEVENSEKSIKNYENQIKLIADQILDEYSLLVNEESLIDGDETYDNIEERRENIIYKLNSSGKHYAFREQLKYTIVNVIRHTFGQTTNIENEDELHKFVAELHVYLVDKMHKALNEMLSIEESIPIPEPITTSEQMKNFACEAEHQKKCELALSYHQDRLDRDTKDPDVWFDFGIFHYSRKEHIKAEYCFKQALTIDRNFMNGLVMYAIVLYEMSMYDKTEIFFEAAINCNENDIAVWITQALFFEAIGNEIGLEMSLSHANRIAESENTPVKENSNDSIFQKLTETESEESKYKNHSISDSTQTSTSQSIRKNETLSKEKRSSKHVTKIVPNNEHQETNENIASVTLEKGENMYLTTAKKLLTLKCSQFMERALAHYVLENGTENTEYLVVLGDYYMLIDDYENGEKNYFKAISSNYQNSNIWAKLGHAYYMQNSFYQAKDCYERTMFLTQQPENIRICYMRLGEIYLNENDYESSKTTYLKACQIFPSCSSWIGVGVNCYKLKNYEDAEQALCEANILNNKIPEVWAYLTLIALKSNKKIEAEKCYKYVIKLKLKNEVLLNEIMQVQKENNFGDTMTHVPKMAQH